MSLSLPQFTTDLPEEMPGVNLMAETTPVPGTNYEGRDFPARLSRRLAMSTIS